MRNDEIEQLAASVAGSLVVELARLQGSPLAAGLAQVLADRAAQELRAGIASLSAVRVEAQEATVSDLRTR